MKRAEIRSRIGTRPGQTEFSHGVNGCMHLEDRVFWLPYLQASVQRELVRLERHGVACRLILPGVQAHLWWLL